MKSIHFPIVLIILLIISVTALQSKALPNLEVLGDVRVQKGSDHLTISNIGSSGIDGISFDVETTFQLHTTNPTTAKEVHLQLDPVAAGDSFFDIFVDAGECRYRLVEIDAPPVSGVQMLLGENQAIEGRDVVGGLGSLVLAPNTSLGGDRLTISNIGSSGDDGVRVDLGDDLRLEGIDDTGSSESGEFWFHMHRDLGRDHLVVSNIGSSGEDGVGIGMRRTVPTEIVQLNLVGSPNFDPGLLIDLGGKGVEHTAPGDEIMVLLRPASGSAAPPHEFRYDTAPGILEIREKGPPNVEYDHNDLVTRYEYDSINRLIRCELQDNTTSAHPDFVHQYDLNPPGGVALPRLDMFGDVQILGTLAKSAGSFKIDHPLDPLNKYLSHSFVESPDMMNVYNGNITTDENGFAKVGMPDYFESLNTDFRYQLTVIGQFADAIIKDKMKNGTFVIQTDKPQVEVSWQVTGVRNDDFARENRIRVESDKEDNKKGTLLYEKKGEEIE